MVHESHLPLTDRALSTMICHSQEKQKFHATGSLGIWNESAEKALMTAFLRGQRTSKQSTSTSTSPAKAIQDIKVDHKAIEDVKVVQSHGGHKCESQKPLRASRLLTARRRVL